MLENLRGLRDTLQYQDTANRAEGIAAHSEALGEKQKALKYREGVTVGATNTLILLAVLEKRVGLNLGTQDVYINVVGGLRITGTAADLPIVLAVVSSFKDLSMDEHTVVMGEVGLTGDIRRVPQARRRLKEAAKMGFTRFIVPRGNMSELKQDDFPDCRIIPVSSIREAITAAFSS